MDPAEPVVTAHLALGNISDKSVRDVLRRACREAAHGPVWIETRAGKRIGAIVTGEQARDVAWREMVRLGEELQGGGEVNATIREGLKAAEREEGHEDPYSRVK